MNEEKAFVIESIGTFNTYSVEIRSKIDGLVKQILFLSAGVQAITIGAFLSGTPPQFHMMPSGCFGLDGCLYRRVLFCALFSCWASYSPW